MVCFFGARYCDINLGHIVDCAELLSNHGTIKALQQVNLDVAKGGRQF